MKYAYYQQIEDGTMSPSMRREWIEIHICRIGDNRRVSPSMRREWIEISILPYLQKRHAVSLHAEGVD